MNRYSDADLAEFKTIIQDKLDLAKAEYDRLKVEIMEAIPVSKSFEDSAEQTLKDELTIMAARQEKLIGELNSAMVRIHNNTYGVCTVTGDLIPKERLRIVPHTTKSMTGKQSN